MLRLWSGFGGAVSGFGSCVVLCWWFGYGLFEFLGFRFWGGFGVGLVLLGF